jgi:hypothetical protein
MATIIWKEPKPQGTAKSRYKARRAAKVAERSFDKSLARNFAEAVTGCSNSVFRAVTAPNWRVKAEPEFVTREDPEYRKVKNPHGQITNARQKMRGKSIPLI